MMLSRFGRPLRYRGWKVFIKKKTMTMAASEKLRNFEAAEILSKRMGIIFLSLSSTQPVEKLKGC